MNIIKKELKERVFVPYTITITVESEQEHKNLYEDFKQLQQMSDSHWYRFQKRLNAVYGLATLIFEHRK